ncbi:hypothetical protein FHX11_000534 [Rhizobium sp. BK602]|nr:hypothetical protein [Rhizobium sp. BK602]
MGGVGTQGAFRTWVNIVNSLRIPRRRIRRGREGSR